jgi:hypothetical protein
MFFLDRFMSASRCLKLGHILDYWKWKFAEHHDAREIKAFAVVDNAVFAETERHTKTHSLRRANHARFENTD